MDQIIIIIVVVALAFGLILATLLAGYFCCYRKRMESNSGRHRKRLPRDQPPATGAMSLDKFPNAAQTKRMEEGQDFVGVHANGTAEPHQEAQQDGNFIMGPSAELAERVEGNDNKGFTKENQVESGSYLRGGVDPADVAEVYMQDDVLKEAARSRRRQQVEVRRKASRNKSSSSKQNRDRNGQKRNSSHKNKSSRP